MVRDNGLVSARQYIHNQAIADTAMAICKMCVHDTSSLGRRTSSESWPDRPSVQGTQPFCQQAATDEHVVLAVLCCLPCCRICFTLSKPTELLLVIVTVVGASSSS